MGEINAYDNEVRALMNKIEKYEQIYMKLMWTLIALGSVFYLITSSIGSIYDSKLVNKTVFICILLLVAAVKQYMINKGYLKESKIYLLFKIIEITLPVIGVFFAGVGEWIYFFTIITLAVSSLLRGMKQGSILLLYFCVINAVICISAYVIPNKNANLSNHFVSSHFTTNLFFLIMNILLVILCGAIYKDNIEGERENKVLLGQLEEKYEQLAVAKDEAKFQYEKIKESNVKLENTNKKLTSSIAEFYTLQQISQAISSIFDIKELLKYVNDIILGVMGVNNSTIILYDEKRKKLKVHTTNIRSRDDLIALNDNINCTILLDVLNNSKPIVENFVDPDEYTFTQGREVNSLICVPLTTKSRKFGIVLIEHKYYSAFDEENARLLDIIGQQVGIAMENAELYQQMQWLATIDGLTGIYNRLYFQDRLQKEFSGAEQDNYPLSLAIFDIDHFKRFNDTYGHLFGDKVLKSISETIKSSLRGTDILARFGGEEFIIMFPRTSLNEAYEKVDALRDKVSKTYVKDSLITASVTISFGLSCYPECSTTEGDLLRHADDALYEAKSSGRNCVKVAKVL